MAKAKTTDGVKDSSTNFVSVACKLPNGLVLQNYNMVDSPEPLQGGASRMVKVAVKDGPPITINGPGRPHGQAPRCPIVMGFAITKRVPADFWERWLAANKDSAIVKNGLIFANPDNDSLRDQAEEHRHQRSGLERMAQNNDPRSPINKNRGLKIETAPEHNKNRPSEENSEFVENED